MIVAHIEGCTRVCGKSQGYLGLPIRDVEYADGTPAMESAWEPTPDELVRLNAGAKVILHVIGLSPQPCKLLVGPVPD